MGSLASLFVPTPLQRPTLPSDANPESRLTPEQRFGLQYSRDRYADGSYQVDAPRSRYNPGPEAAITSFYGVNKRLPDGRVINMPSFWDGRVRDDPADALARALAYEKQMGGQFARYPTDDAALWGEMQAVHPIMDQDSQRVLATPEAQRRLRAMLPQGGRR